MKIKKTIILLSLALLMGCTSKETQRINPKKSHLTTIRWGANDLQEMANEMVSNILSSNIDFSKNYSIGKIKNSSHDHINSKLLGNKISTTLIQSKKVHIVQEKSGKDNAVFFGKISSILKKNDRTKDMFFNFNLTLIDKSSSKVIWTHDVPIRKIQKKALFGW